jgi:hypothetical protein
LNYPEIKQFPNLGYEEDDNLSIRLFGRRFFQAQTIVEYLAEFLLVFASPKGRELNYKMDFPVPFNNDFALTYKVKSLISLKLFSFFSSSKLETRHPVHHTTFKTSSEDLKKLMKGTIDPNESIQILQSIFLGFQGISKNRTWATYTFLPVTSSLLAGEVVWGHNVQGAKSITKWKDSEKYFSQNQHLFMARGGEELFLQLLNLFNKKENELNIKDNYFHLKNIKIEELKSNITSGLEEIITKLENSIGKLVQFIENNFIEENSKIRPEIVQNCGWIPENTIPESLLFAFELQNICNSSLSSLQKIELLKTLCTMQVLRSLCFQSARYTLDPKETPMFMGNYCWIISPPDDSNQDLKKLSAKNYQKVEQMIFSAIRNDILFTQKFKEKKSKTKEERYKKADKDGGYALFRKLGKEIGLIVPRKGQNTRFVLNQDLVRFFAISLIPPGTRIRLNEFLERIYLHYGIAVSSSQLERSCSWTGSEVIFKSAWNDLDWFAKALRAEGFLAPLSDAISIVQNPFGDKDE